MSDGFSGMVIVDGDGSVVWYFRAQRAVIGVTRRLNGNFVLLDADLGLLEITPAGKVVRTLPQEPEGRTIHHDVVAAPNGTLVFLRNDRRLVDDTLVVGKRSGSGIPKRMPRGASGRPSTTCRHAMIVVGGTPPPTGCMPTPSSSVRGGTRL